MYISAECSNQSHRKWMASWMHSMFVRVLQESPGFCVSLVRVPSTCVHPTWMAKLWSYAILNDPTTMNISVCTYIYTHTYTCICICMYMYIYRCRDIAEYRSCSWWYLDRDQTSLSGDQPGNHKLRSSQSALTHRTLRMNQVLWCMILPKAILQVTHLDDMLWTNTDHECREPIYAHMSYHILK